MPKVKKKPPNISTLLTKEKIDKYTVEPWTLEKIIEISPVLQKIAIRLKGKGYKLSDFKKLDNIQEELPKLIFTILPELPEFFSVTLNRSLEEMKKLSPELAYILMLKIVQQNTTYLKNLSGLGKQMLVGLIKEILG